MIKLKSKYDYETNTTVVRLKHKHSCTLEMLDVIYKLMKEIEKFTDLTRKDIYKYLKEIEKENDEEIEVL